LTIIWVFGFAMIMISIIIMAIFYHSTLNIMSSYSNKSLQQVTLLIEEHTEQLLNPVADSVKLVQQINSTRLLDNQQLLNLEALYFSQINLNPNIASLDFGQQDGQFMMVKRMADQSIATQKIKDHQIDWFDRHPNAHFKQIKEHRHIPYDPYDPRERPWYQGAITQQGIYWTGVYMFATDQQPAITASITLKDKNNHITSVSSASLTLKKLSAFLTTIDLGEGKAFILNKDLKVIAMPNLIHYFNKKNHELPKLNSMPDKRMHSFAKISMAQQDKINFEFSVDNENYFGVLSKFNYFPDNHWYIGAFIPEKQLLGKIKKANYYAIGISFTCLVMALILIYFIAKRITKPLCLLAKEATKMQDLDFNDSFQSSSIFEELDQTLTSFRKMRDRVRVLGRYAPTQLVLKLLKSHKKPELGGETKCLTLFFSDIENFSSYAESCHAEKIAKILGLYLHITTDVIKSHQGTVDKYMGDGIMAFWNAPDTVKKHAKLAVYAALDCLEAIEEMEDPRLYTRIGIHTAEVVVGNFGSPERFNYTAVGDGVNLAARLEGVNRYYKTQLIISNETYQQVKSKVVCRQLDNIAVKGKKQSCLIYEVIGKVNTVEQSRLDFIEYYEQGMLFYYQKDFSQALEKFEQAEQIIPNDCAVSILKKRAAGFIDNPPTEDWCGVYCLTTK